MFRRMHYILVGLIVATAAGTSIAAVVIVDRAVEAAARTDIEAELRELSRYRSDFKIVSIADAIDFRVAPGSQPSMLYLLVRGDGSQVVGNLAEWPPEVPKTAGWYRFKLAEPGGSSSDILANVSLIDGAFPVLVGQRLSAYGALKREFVPLVIVLVLVLSVALLLIVFRTSALFRDRVTQMNSLLTRVGEGHLHERVAAAELARGDELAELARHINLALDENARLMTGLDAVSQTAAHEINKELSHLRDLAAANQQPELVASADALLQLLGEILELSRVESSTGAMMTNVDLAEVVESASSLYADAYADANVALVVDAPPVTVLGQSHLLTNAVANLLNNALRHSPLEGCVRVLIEVAADSVTLSVVDEGEGAESDDLREILRRTRQGQVAGYGFGLRFVQAVAIRHGAQMRISNTSPGFKVSMVFAARQRN